MGDSGDGGHIKVRHVISSEAGYVCEGGMQCASGALGNGIKIRVEINIWIHDAHQEHGHH